MSSIISRITVPRLATEQNQFPDINDIGACWPNLDLVNPYFFLGGRRSCLIVSALQHSRLRDVFSRPGLLRHVLGTLYSDCATLQPIPNHTFLAAYQSRYVSPEIFNSTNTNHGSTKHT